MFDRVVKVASVLQQGIASTDSIDNLRRWATDGEGFAYLALFLASTLVVLSVHESFAPRTCELGL